MLQAEGISAVTLPALLFIRDKYPRPNTVAYMLFTPAILCKWGNLMISRVTEEASAPGST